MNIDKYNTDVTINAVVIRLNGGANEVSFDDTFAQMDIVGGNDDEGKFLNVCQTHVLFGGGGNISFSRRRPANNTHHAHTHIISLHSFS